MTISFFYKHCGRSERGVIIKCPYTTNKFGYHFRISDVFKVVEKLTEIANEVIATHDIIKPRVPYVLVQPFLSNTKEMKVACYGGKFHHI